MRTGSFRMPSASLASRRNLRSLTSSPHPSDRLTNCHSLGLLQRPVTLDVASRAGTEVVRKVHLRQATLAVHYSMISSALASKVAGTVRPSAAAVLRLITNSRRGLQNRQFRGFVAVQYFSNVGSCFLIGVKDTGAVAHQSADRRELGAIGRRSAPSSTRLRSRGAADCISLQNPASTIRLSLPS